MYTIPILIIDDDIGDIDVLKELMWSAEW
jgi:hypothetical protein